MKRYQVKLTVADWSNRIAAIKAARKMLGTGLGEAKDFVDSLYDTDRFAMPVDAVMTEEQFKSYLLHKYFADMQQTAPGLRIYDVVLLPDVAKLDLTTIIARD